jgi:hypothetical protein
MSHAPECFLAKTAYPVGTDFCICDRLRAAEKRARADAREAVAAVPLVNVWGNMRFGDSIAADALAAIDALAVTP